MSGWRTCPEMCQGCGLPVESCWRMRMAWKLCYLKTWWWGRRADGQE